VAASLGRGAALALSGATRARSRRGSRTRGGAVAASGRDFWAPASARLLLIAIDEEVAMEHSQERASDGRIRNGIALAGLLAAGCLGEVGELGDEVVDSELAGEASYDGAKILHAARLYYTNPEVSKNQWAEASVNGTTCNGVMIGPSIYFSAAHCGIGDDAWITFRTYRNGSHEVSDSESFLCHGLVHTFVDTDGILCYCEPNAAGVAPGDKYGYVDFDVTLPAPFQVIYSISANYYVDGSVPRDARMVAIGRVLSVGLPAWFAPDASPNRAIDMRMYGEGGMSGSPHFDAISHRMIIAPLSTAGSWSRQALSMRDLLYWGRANSFYDPAVQGPTVFESQVAALGLTPASYYGWVDKDLDWEFDVQEDLERLQGSGSAAGTGSTSTASGVTRCGTCIRSRASTPSITRWSCGGPPATASSR
jgi:hypothetical protein